MSQRAISSDSAVIIQMMMLLFFIPFVLFVSYTIISKRFDSEGVGILSILMLIAFIVIRGSLTYGDIYLDGDNVIVKKITGAKSRNVSEVKSLKRIIIPVVYRIDFNDHKRVYFMMKFSDVLSQLTNNSSATELNFLKSKINK